MYTPPSLSRATALATLLQMPSARRPLRFASRSGYGKRWQVESFFSGLKRTTG
jgi:hypothetical protein